MPGNKAVRLPRSAPSGTAHTDPPADQNTSDTTRKRTPIARQHADQANLAERQARSAQQRADELAANIAHRDAVSRARIETTDRLSSAPVAGPRLRGR